MPRAILEIRTAKDSLETPEATIQLMAGIKNVLQATFFQRLLHSQPTITLEIASLNQSVHFVVTVDEEHAGLVKSQIAAQYPTAVINTLDDYLPPWSNYGHHVGGQLALTAPNYLPLKTYLKFQTTDPLSTVLGILGKIPAGSASIIQIVLSAAPGHWSSAGRNAIKKGVSTDPLVFKAHPQAALIEEKLSTPAFHAGIRLLAIAPQHDLAESILSQTAAAFGSFALSDSNSLKLKKVTRITPFLTAMEQRNTQDIPLWQYLNLSELATLYHFPGLLHAGLRNLAWGKTVKGEAPDHLPTTDTPVDPTQITFYAKTEYKNRLMPYGILLPDRRRHFYILGKSGTGKSTLIANMAIADMENNQGMAVIDPHGDLCEILLDHIPDHRVKDVVYLDPANALHPFHLNPLEVHRPEHKELVASGIVGIFQKIFYYSWGPRLEYILRNTIMTLVEVPDTTLLDVPKLLTDNKFRAQIVAKLNPELHSVLINFWKGEFDQYQEKLRTEAVAPILNKVGQFVGSPTIRAIIGQPKSTINLEEIMNSGKIILLNLSQGKLGEDNAALLGAMFITQFQLAAMNRINVPEEQRRDFFLYVDEFQNFATTSFIKILSEARKFRLGLVLANQYIAQLPEEIQKAIFGNVGTMITFVVGADDANHIIQEFGNLYTQDDLVSLGKYQIINKISIDGRISGPFPAYTLPLPEHKTNNRHQVMELSKSRFLAQTTPAPSPVSPPTPPPPSPAPENPPRQPSPAPRPNQPPTRPSQPPRSQTLPPARPFPSSAPKPAAPSKPTHHRPTTTDLDALRRQGFRPTVVGCFLKDKKILLGYQKKFDLWQLPQGGVDNRETIESALFREMSEELEVPIYADKKYIHYLGEDQIEFPPEKHAAKELASDAGQPLVLKGKHYFFFSLNLPNFEVNHSNHEYDRLQWFPFDQAVQTLKKSVRGGKLRITLTLLENLHRRGLLD